MLSGFQLDTKVDGLDEPQTEVFLSKFLGGTYESPPAVLEKRLLKYSPLRLVLRVSGEQGRPLVLKLYRSKGSIERLRSLWLRSRAIKEKRNLDIARERGLPCPRAVEASCAPGIFPKTGHLLLEDLGPGASLPELLQESAMATQLLSRVGRLIAQILAAGLLHRDLHLGNFFVATNGDLFLLDLHSAQFRREGIRTGVSHLKALYLSLPWPEQAQLREALFAPLDLPATPPDLARWHRRALDKRLTRCLRNSGSFYRLGTSILRRSFLNGRDMNSIEHAIAKAVPLKSGRRGTVQRTSLGIFKMRKNSQGTKLWLASHALEQRQLGTPQSLALLRRGKGQSLVLCSELKDSTAIDRLETGLSAAAREFGKSYGRLHATGWRCRDPRGDNVHLSSCGKLSFVDLDGVGPLPFWRRLGASASDLGRLLAWLRHEATLPCRSKHESLARTFLAAYLRERRALAAPVRRARALVRAIQLRAKAWERLRVRAKIT